MKRSMISTAVLVIVCLQGLAQEEAPEGWIETSSVVLDIGEELTFEAGGYDAEDEPLTFQWNFGDDSEEEGLEVVHCWQHKGVYEISVVATNASGLSDPTPFYRYVFVNDPEDVSSNLEPLMDIDYPTFGAVFDVAEAIDFVAVGFDLDQDEISFYWDFDDGSLAEGEHLTKTYGEVLYSAENDAQIAPYEITLFARDARGLTREYGLTIPIVLYDQEPPPDGVITEPQPSVDEEGFDNDEPLILRPGKTLSFRGEPLDEDSDDEYCGLWTVTNVIEGVEGYDFELSYDQFEAPGTYFVLFTLVDKESGMVDPVPAFLELIVRDSNTPPSYVEIVEPAYDDILPLGTVLDLAAEAEDEDGDALNYTWQVSLFGGNSVATYEGERVAGVRIDEEGLYRISLEARDESGGSTFAIETRYLFFSTEERLNELDYNDLPVVTPQLPNTDRLSIPLRSMMSFSFTATSPVGNQITEYYIDTGDATSNTSILNNLTFDKPGYRIIKAFARDETGLWSLPYYWGVYTYEDNLPPEATINIPPLVPDQEYDEFRRASYVYVGSSLTFEGVVNDQDSTRPATPIWVIEEEIEEEYIGNLKPTFKFDDVGEYEIELFAVDSEQGYSPFPDSRYVFALNPGDRPDSNIIEPGGDEIVVEPGEPVYFFGYGSYDVEVPMQLEWTFPDSATLPATYENEVDSVVFNEESSEGEPFEIRLTAYFEVAIDGQTVRVEDSTPAIIKVHVRRYEDGDFEPNNSFAEAPIIQQGAYNNLSLDGAGSDEVDYFRFIVTESGKDLHLNLNVPEGVEAPELQFYRQNGDTWEELDAARVSELVGGSVTLENLTAGTYAAEIRVTGEGKRKRRALSYSFGLSTLEPALYMPFMVEDGNFSSSIGIINTAAEVADLAIQGLDSQGRPISCKTAQLPPNGRMFLTGVTLFGMMNNKAVARDVNWIKVSSTHRLVGYTNAQTKDNKQLSAMSAIRTLAPSALVPHVADRTDTWYTRAVMVNVDMANQSLEFTSPLGAQTIAESTLKAGQQLDLRFTNLFPEGLPTWGRFKNKDNQATLAGFELFGRVDGFKQVAGLELVDLRDKNPNFLRIDGNLYFTHIADTNVFWTGIALVNAERTKEATFNIVAYNDQGEVEARLDGQTLPVGGKLRDTSANLFPGVTNIAWIVVETPFDMAGFELFGDYDGKILAGFEAARSLTSTLYFPHLQVQAGAWYTGIALLNISQAPIQIQLDLYNDLGQVLLTRQETLDPRKKLVRLAQLIFPEGLPVGSSYLKVSVVDGSRVLSGFEIYGTLDPNAPWGELLGGLSALKD